MKLGDQSMENNYIHLYNILIPENTERMSLSLSNFYPAKIIIISHNRTTDNVQGGQTTFRPMSYTGADYNIEDIHRSQRIDIKLTTLPEKGITIKTSLYLSGTKEPAIKVHSISLEALKIQYLSSLTEVRIDCEKVPFPPNPLSLDELKEKALDYVVGPRQEKVILTTKQLENAKDKCSCVDALMYLGWVYKEEQKQFVKEDYILPVEAISGHTPKTLIAYLQRQNLLDMED